MEFRRVVSGQYGLFLSVCCNSDISSMMAALLASKMFAFEWRAVFLDDHASFVARRMYAVA